jgi:hypothetical protein
MREKEEHEECEERRECPFCSSRGFFCFVEFGRPDFGSARFWSVNLMSSLLPFGDVAAEKEKVFHGSFVARSEL